jgi:hypothetical protein
MLKQKNISSKPLPSGIRLPTSRLQYNSLLQLRHTVALGHSVPLGNNHGSVLDIPKVRGLIAELQQSSQSAVPVM